MVRSIKSTIPQPLKNSSSTGPPFSGGWIRYAAWPGWTWTIPTQSSCSSYPSAWKWGEKRRRTRRPVKQLYPSAWKWGEKAERGMGWRLKSVHPCPYSRQSHKISPRHRAQNGPITIISYTIKILWIFLYTFFISSQWFCVYPFYGYPFFWIFSRKSLDWTVFF